MANCVIVGGGGGGVLSSDVTASKANVLAGTRTITSDSANEVVSGTMVNRGTINKTLGINESYTIPQGYHSGSGKVSQSVTTKGAATYYANASTNQTIAANQYLTGVQTISKLTQSNLASGNILRGKTISVHNGNANVWSVTGSNNVLKYSNGTAKGTSNRTTFSLRSGGTTYTKAMYYVDVAPGFTPVFVIVISDQTIMWRYDATSFNYVTRADDWDGIYTFVTPSDAPFTSSQCRLFFSRYNSSATTNVWYWIFGY